MTACIKPMMELLLNPRAQTILGAQAVFQPRIRVAGFGSRAELLKWPLPLLRIVTTVSFASIFISPRSASIGSVVVDRESDRWLGFSPPIVVTVEGTTGVPSEPWAS